MISLDQMVAPPLERRRLDEAAGLSDAYLVSKANKVVEAAGIEPFSPTYPNPMMANDFGYYCVRTFELQHRFDSPGVPSSPLESSPVLEK